jgi:hypothetical protein
LSKEESVIIRSAVAGLALTLMAMGGAHASDGGTSSDAKALALMAQFRAASGGAALDRHVAFHETGTIVRDGQTGTYEMYGDLHALRTAGVHTLNGKFGGGGFDGDTAWHLEPDGEVSTTRDPEAVREAKAGAYFTIGGYNWPDRFPATFTYVGVETYKSKSYDVVRVTPDGAAPNDLWLDRRTHWLARITETISGQPASADILTNRRVDGTVIGFKSYQVEPGHSMIQTLATYDYVPLDPARFAPPRGK